MSMYYRRAEAQKRYTLMFVSASLAGAFSGLLASAIGKMDGIRGFRGWRWVFILEGLLTCVGAVIAYFSVSDFPENAKWLSEEEREFLKVRLREDVGESGYEEKFTVQRAMKAILDHKVVLGGLMYFGLIVPAYSIVYFAPSIIAHLGHGAIHAQLLSVPPLACGFAIGIIVATLSDYYAHRFLFATVCCMVSIAGFGILLTVHDNPNLQYAAILIASAGTYPAMPIVLCWFGMNVRGHLNRAVATGYQISFGNVGGIIASYAFLAKDAPEFHTGYRICLSFVCLAALACLLYFLSVAWENRKADSKERSDAEGGDSSGSSQFRFIY
ncbi:High-affinity nicotinic acid transporter [Marasmius crinis-equi]|uniref:High-affinity nicotinic acid transporter n=1 Tax=Marasmius crinis-equi TaxID=585013 RepID=A0ABR3ERH7_9AGAR